MPYKNTSELPDGVKNNLPARAARIYMGAYNAAFKQYGGSEEKAAKVAWSAVKKKFQKKGDKWVAKSKSQARCQSDFQGLLADTKRLYQAFFEADGAPQDGRDEVMGLLARVEADPKAHAAELAQINELATPVMGDLLQYWMERTRSADHEHDFPGSLDHLIRRVCAAVREQAPDYIGKWGYVLAVYPDSIVTCASGDDEYYYDRSDMDYWSLGWMMGEDGAITIGEAQPVDVFTVVANPSHTPMETPEHHEIEGAEGQEMAVAADPSFTGNLSNLSVDEQAKAKTEDGKSFGKSAYLIVRDPEKPTTWKVRVEETPGKITGHQLGAAHAALTGNYRGETLDATAEEKAAALKKLKSLYKTHKIDWPEGKQNVEDEAPVLNQDPQWFTPPDWALQHQPPPGGPDELTQTFSAEVTQKTKDEKGVMHVKGVATVGNVLNMNDQVYPTQVWQDNLPFLQAMIDEGSLLGESDHPATKKPSLDRTCMIFDKLTMDGDKMLFEGRVLPTIPSGQNLQVLLEAGAKVDISSRGRGKTKTGDWVNPTTGERYENVAVIQRGFKCQAFDAVVSGASPGATITEYQTVQQALDSAEEIDMKELEALTQQVSSLAAIVGQIAGNQKTQAPEQEPAAAPATTAVADPPRTETPAPPVEQAAAPPPIPDTPAGASAEALAAVQELLAQQKLMLPILLDNRKREILAEVKQNGMPQQWVNSLRQTIERAAPQTLQALEDLYKQSLPILQTQYAAAPAITNGEGWKVEQDAGNRPGPKTPMEMIDFLVKDLPDDCLFNPFMICPESGKKIYAQDRIKTPRRQVRAILLQTAKHQDESWNGPAAMQAFVHAWQGQREEFIADAWLHQACADGTTSVAAGGAPSSALFIFPLIRMVYPKLIVSEISSIQPMDRPDGRIFFLNALRIVPGMDVVDQAGTTLTDRMFLNRSSSFSSSYANRAAECDEAQKIQLRLASVSVTAANKALYTINTIEELQDLRAYHGLDVGSELVSAASREVAIEWNLTVLEDLVAGATGGTLTFGTVAPTGYTQKEWSEYLPRYIDAASMNIFQLRYGMATHVIAGPNATLKLGASYRTPVQPSGDNPEIFAGMTLTPWMAGMSANLKVYNTAFWAKASDTNRILVMRRGTDWSDTAHVFAPYIDYVSPVLTLPDTFTQKQGIMSRAAHRVVVGDAIAVINIVPGATGVEL